MEIVIVILSLIIIIMFIVFWGKMKQLEKKTNEVEKEYRDTIKMQEFELKEVVQERDDIQKQVASYVQQIDEMKKEMSETTRKLEFYKNIKEESGKLNVSDDEEEREIILEQVSKHIKDVDVQEDKEDFQTEESVLDQEQDFARYEMESDNKNFFITGKAGTGKSFLLDVFRRTTKKRHIVLAPTGIAALNVNGVTLHSTFGYYNLVNLDIDKISDDTIRLKSEKKMILKQVSTIIIDEISMVRADTFDKIDKILKVINRNNLPFGGKQILLFGDLFQLPPVTKSNEHKFLYDRYGGEFFFCSDAFKQADFKFIELTINHRQKDDLEYFTLLNRVRDGSLEDSDIDVLNSRVVEDTSIYDRFTTLLPTKAEAEQLNQYHIDQLDSEEYVYHAKIVYDKYPNNTRNLESVFPISSTLRLKKGALVMMVANDSEHRWVNGTLGIVSQLSQDSISVAINKRIYKIYPQDFNEQEITYENSKLIYEDILKVTQYPIVLAYAITIHKSQGLTYQNIVCDIDRCFANGQAYVALSRCASLDGLHLKQTVNRSSIRVDERIVSFYREQISKHHVE